MSDIIRYPQFDIDYNNSDGEEEVDCESFYQTSEEQQSNIKSIGSLQSDEALKFGFEALPSETLLQLLLHLNDPFDIVSLSAVNQFFNTFIKKNSTSLARQLISVVELRGSYANEDDDKVHSIVMNLTGTCYGSKRLWKSLSFKENTINKINIEMFAPKMFFADESVIRMDNIEITKACLPSFTRFIEKMIRIDYPGCRRKIEFELRISDCSFKKVARQDIHQFIDTMIEYGCTNLTFNCVAFEDYTKICRALSKSQLHLLNVFRFHSDDITTNRAKTLQYIFKPFCNLGRKTTKLVIDGIMIPLEICEWVMVQFCCTPFYTSLPPALRIVMSIHRNYSRQELADIINGVRIGAEEQRSKLKRRVYDVHLVLGMYESDVYLTQNQHCVVDVKPSEPKSKNVQQQRGGADVIISS